MWHRRRTWLRQLTQGMRQIVDQHVSIFQSYVEPDHAYLRIVSWNERALGHDQRFVAAPGDGDEEVSERFAETLDGRDVSGFQTDREHSHRHLHLPFGEFGLWTIITERVPDPFYFW